MQIIIAGSRGFLKSKVLIFENGSKII